MPIQTAASIFINIPAVLLLILLLLSLLRNARSREVHKSRSHWTRDSNSSHWHSWGSTNGSATQGKVPRMTADASVQIEDSTHDRIIAELRASLATATEALSQSRQEFSIARAEATAKDLHITSLVEARRELQTLCSAMQAKTTNDEATIIKLTGRLAKFEAEGISQEARIISLTKKKEEWNANAASMQEMITLQEAALPQLTNILRTQDEHNDALSQTVKSSKQSLAEKDTTIDHLNVKLTEHACENDSMRDRISSLVEECEDLESLRKSMTGTATQNEETIARLRLNLEEMTTAAGDWKDLYIQSLSQPHQPRMHTNVPSSTQGIIAEKDRKIAELNECYNHLLANQAGNLGRDFSLPPIIVVGDDLDVDLVGDSHKPYTGGHSWPGYLDQGSSRRRRWNSQQ